MKHILSAAILALPLACIAQTEAPSLIITGSINAQLESVGAPGATNTLSAADAARVATRSRLNQNGSELRFSGQRAFGNGMEGFFTIGSEVQSFSGANANNTNTFAVRNTGVGIRGAFGEVALGRWDSHYHWGPILVDRAYLTSGLAGDSKALNSFVNGTVFVGNRFSNTVRYNTPTFAGVTAHVIVSRNDGTVTAVPVIGELADRSVNLAITYRSGDLIAFASYFDRDEASAPLPFAAAATASAMSQKSRRAGASYLILPGLTAGVIVDVTSQTHRTAASSGLGIKRTAWTIPLRYQTGPHQLAVTLASAADSTGSLMPASVVGTNADTGARFMQFGYQYALDKATNLQFTLAKVSNSRNGSYDLSLNAGLGIAGLAATRGADPRTVQIGMRYAF